MKFLAQFPVWVNPLLSRGIESPCMNSIICMDDAFENNILVIKLVGIHKIFQITVVGSYRHFYVKYFQFNLSLDLGIMDKAWLLLNAKYWKNSCRLNFHL